MRGKRSGFQRYTTNRGFELRSSGPRHLVYPSHVVRSGAASGSCWGGAPTAGRRVDTRVSPGHLAVVCVCPPAALSHLRLGAVASERVEHGRRRALRQAALQRHARRRLHGGGDAVHARRQDRPLHAPPRPPPAQPAATRSITHESASGKHAERLGGVHANPTSGLGDALTPTGCARERACSRRGHV
jgi:hypothetical protein